MLFLYIRQWCQKKTPFTCRRCNGKCYVTKILPELSSDCNRNLDMPKFTNRAASSNLKKKSSDNKNSLTSATPNPYNSCKKCLGTGLNMDSTIVFRPQKYSYYEFVASPNPNFKKGI